VLDDRPEPRGVLHALAFALSCLVGALLLAQLAFFVVGVG
jgi:hypothetical protein